MGDRRHWTQYRGCPFVPPLGNRTNFYLPLRFSSFARHFFLFTFGPTKEKKRLYGKQIKRSLFNKKTKKERSLSPAISIRTVPCPTIIYFNLTSLLFLDGIREVPFPVSKLTPPSHTHHTYVWTASDSGTGYLSGARVRKFSLQKFILNKIIF